VDQNLGNAFISTQENPIRFGVQFGVWVSKQLWGSYLDSASNCLLTFIYLFFTHFFF